MGFLGRLFGRGAVSVKSCCMCRKPIYGEETVIEMQKQAVYVQRNPSEAIRVEQQSGYKCRGCGREYCKNCLETRAPANSLGGKSCPRCGNLFEIIHG